MRLKTKVKKIKLEPKEGMEDRCFSAAKGVSQLLS